jgi:hypothetical protein
MKNTSIQIVDAHATCGIIDNSFPQTYEDYQRQIVGTQIDAAAFSPPAHEIYNRYNRNFSDTPTWQQQRKKSNAYLLDLNPTDLKVYPFFFIWNDFTVDQITDFYCGIKWYRHDCEPVYHYDNSKCRLAIKEIRRRNLPVILGDTFKNIKRFIKELAQEVQVIIPHLGCLNGGFETIAEAGLWELENVWANTALAPSREIDQYLRFYGHRRLIFGSGFPIGNVGKEVDKIRTLNLEAKAESAVLKNNFLRLQENIVYNADLRRDETVYYSF